MFVRRDKYEKKLERGDYFYAVRVGVSQWYSESRTRWMLLVRITGVGRTTNSVAGSLVESF